MTISIREDGVTYDAEGEQHLSGRRESTAPGVPSIRATLTVFARPARASATALAPRTRESSRGAPPVAVCGRA